MVDEDYYLDKITKENILNSSDLTIMNLLICPIDNKICSTRVLCTLCETMFCIDCSLKHNTCNGTKSNLIDPNYTICQVEINKIVIECPLNCKCVISFTKIRQHLSVCFENIIKCSRCLLPIKNKEHIQHLISNCKETMIKCYLCKKEITIETVMNNHLSFCNKDKHEKQTNHLIINQCPNCSLPYLFDKLNCENKHICININVQNNKQAILTHFKKINTSLELIAINNRSINADNNEILIVKGTLNKTFKDIELLINNLDNSFNELHNDYLNYLNLKRIKIITNKVEEIKLKKQDLNIKMKTITELLYQIKYYSQHNSMNYSKEEIDLAMSNAAYINQSYKNCILNRSNHVP